LTVGLETKNFRDQILTSSLIVHLFAIGDVRDRLIFTVLAIFSVVQRVLSIFTNRALRS